jgi:glutathione S-transferase
MMSTKLDVVLNVIAGTVRGWRGALVKGKAQKQPEKLLKLYDIEVSPFCRLVREVLSELDLDVIIYPCPVGGTRFRPYAKGLLPHVTFPLLVDENSGMVMCESALIMAYLGTSYNGKVKVQKAVGRGWSIATSLFSSLLSWRRGGLKGLKVCPSKAPILPLELYGFESSPYVRPVRARMCELELPYICVTRPKAL